MERRQRLVARIHQVQHAKREKRTYQMLHCKMCCQLHHCPSSTCHGSLYMYFALRHNRLHGLFLCRGSCWTYQTPHPKDIA
jgi:hypothetical protein